MDNLFLLAVAAFGWGLSLCTYRLFARSNGWPMGALQADLPFIPVVLGVLGLAAGLMFATARGPDEGGWAILACGFLLAVLWTGFLRVGSQISLFLVPVATFLLLLGWLGEEFVGYRTGNWSRESLSETLQRRGYVPNDPRIVAQPPTQRQGETYGPPAPRDYDASRPDL